MRCVGRGRGVGGAEDVPLHLTHPRTTPGGRTAVPRRAGPTARLGDVQKSGFASILDRLAAPRVLMATAIANLIAQIGICVTGSLVRVTGSGLGCETWPECHEGSFTPVAGAAPALHQGIEFGNRLLTYVLGVIALALLIGVIRAGRSARIRALAWATFAGIPLQAVVGGITVLMGLVWWTVALHMLLSMVLVWIAGLVVVRLRQSDDAPERQLLPTTLRTLGVLAAVAMTGALITGTMVTGAGPHAGDDRVVEADRLGIDIQLLVHIHAEFVVAFLALLVGLWFGARAVKAPRSVIVKIAVTGGMILLQTVVGLVQYWLKVPAWLVPIHILIAGAIVGHLAMLHASTRLRTEEEIGEPVAATAR